MRQSQSVNFEISISGRNDGTLEAMYIQLLNETVHHTEEIKEDILLADYTDDGRLVGIEVLSPVRLADLVKLIKESKVRKNFRKFVGKSAPRDLVMA